MAGIVGGLWADLMRVEVYDESSGEVITIERESNMSIKTVAAKAGMKSAKQGLKMLWAWYRPWRTKLAYKREVEAEKRKAQSTILPMMFIAAFALSGCASLDKVYTGVDRTLHNGALDPYQNQVPEGYEIKAFVRDQSGDRVDITGWSVEEEMVKAATWTPRPLTIEPRGNRKGNPLSDVLDVVKQIEAKDAQPSGASEAIDLLKEEAAK
jgi:hypothetical protein